MAHSIAGQRTRSLPIALAGALLLSVGTGVAAANSVPHPELRINLFAPPATMPADTPFWIGGGFSTELDENPAAGAPGFARFELYVDGSAIDLRKDVEYAGGQSVESNSILWYRNFDAGLVAGEHHFAGRWYTNGSLILSLDADVLFE